MAVLRKVSRGIPGVSLLTSSLGPLCRGRLCLQQRAWVWLTLPVEGDEAAAEEDAGEEEEDTPGHEKIS